MTYTVSNGTINSTIPYHTIYLVRHVRALELGSHNIKFGRDLNLWRPAIGSEVWLTENNFLALMKLHFAYSYDDSSAESKVEISQSIYPFYLLFKNFHNKYSNDVLLVLESDDGSRGSDGSNSAAGDNTTHVRESCELLVAAVSHHLVSYLVIDSPHVQFVHFYHASSYNACRAQFCYGKSIPMSNCPSIQCQYCV